MDNVHLTHGHIRASKGTGDGTIVISPIGDLPESGLVWACPSAGGELSLASPIPFAHGPAPASTGANKRLVGAYRRKSGLQLRYTYSGSYGVDSEGSSWQVVVRCNRRLRGTPAGVLKGITSPDASTIRALVEKSIEELVQMKE